MKKTFIPLMLMAILLLSACSSQAPDPIQKEVPSPSTPSAKIETNDKVEQKGAETHGHQGDESEAHGHDEAGQEVVEEHPHEAGEEAHGHDDEVEAHDDTGQPPHRH